MINMLKSVQLVRGSSFRHDLLQNQYFRNRRYSRANWLHPLCQEIKIIADVDDLNIPLFGDIAF